MFKFIGILLISITIVSCNQKSSYYEYDIKNSSKNEITVTIITNGENYKENIEYVIAPNQIGHVFEHQSYGIYKDKWPLEKIQDSCIFIKKIVIINSEGKKSNKDFFCNNCATLVMSEGVLGKYGNYLLEIKDSNFE